jgi:hypothetical protein
MRWNDALNGIPPFYFRRICVASLQLRFIPPLANQPPSSFLKIENPPPPARKLTREADADKSGTLSFPEFQKIFQRVLADEKTRAKFEKKVSALN